jgi:CheY-like chemotaxis protein
MRPTLAPLPREPPVRSPVQQQQSPLTVLVADDEEIVRHLCARILEDAGYRVLTAADGFQALEMVRQFGSEIQLLVSDLKMPRLDGLQLAEWLSSLHIATPVIFISGYNLDRPTDRQVLAKPFHPSDLIVAVERTLESGPRLVRD